MTVGIIGGLCLCRSHGFVFFLLFFWNRWQCEFASVQVHRWRRRAGPKTVDIKSAKKSIFHRGDAVNSAGEPGVLTRLPPPFALDFYVMVIP